jgi:cell shape-determining protein MreC
MKTNKITKDKILATIQEEAAKIKRKVELYNEVKKINEELKFLNENQGLVGTFGFAANANDVAKKSANGTGFVNHMNLSHIAQLEREMGISENKLDEAEALKQENENLKKELEEIKKTLQTKPI